MSKAKPDAAQPTPSPFAPRVAVARVRRQFQVQATQDVASGEPILHVDGVLVQRPSRYTIQVGDHAHVELPGPVSLEEELDHHSWRFLNHSCAPNATLRGRWLVALRPVSKGDEVTFDYATTEYDMCSPFPCGCGAAECLGIVRGFRYLSTAQQQARAPHLAEHLRQRLHEGATRGANSVR